MRVRMVLSGALCCSLLLAGLSPFSPVASAAKKASCAGPSKGGDWPVFQHDVTATGSQPKESTIGVDNVGDLELAWVAPLELGEGTEQTFAGAGTVGVESPPVEDGGCVYISTQEGTVSAFNVNNGKLVWSKSLPSATTLSVANGRVFAQSSSILTAMDAKTGKTIWKENFTPGPDFGGIGSPLAFEDFLVAGTTNGSRKGGVPGRERVGYYAIVDQATGKVVASGFDVSKEDHNRGMEGSGFWSHPTYDPEDKYIYFGTAEPRSVAPENPLANALVKIDADPSRATFGKIVGHFRTAPLNGDTANTPFVGALWCGPDNPVPTTVSGVLCHDDFDWASSALIYRDSTGRKLLGSTHPSMDPLPRLGGAFFGPPKGNFFAIDPTTPPSSDFAGSRMKSVWSAPTSGARAAVAAYDGSKIYYSSGYDGEIVAVDKDTGAIAWKASTLGLNLWQHISVANGVVYTPSGAPGFLVSAGPGMLLAFDARDGTPLLQRPMTMDIGDVSRGTVAGGVIIARNTVFVPTNGAAGAYLVAYRLPSR
ncbi:MAG: PQQ-binding-like beta-propeller repeat protein [Actinomycetota bacterium]|nr:PQQ-binding-like beta-propeller repeat protein [Actinomycetota bacterium]